MSEEMTLAPTLIEKLALHGDVSNLKPEEKIAYYKSLCARVGLDPATQPFKLLSLSGKQVFYCDRSGAQQLSRLHGVSHEIRAREVVNDCYVVTCRASAGGRSTESIGAVSIAKLAGEALCNAYMKGETKAKRRATLDLLGLGMLDESEVASIPGAEPLALPPDTPPPAIPPQAAPAPPPFNAVKARIKALNLLQAAPGQGNRALFKAYCVAQKWLGENEQPEDWPEQFLPHSQEDMAKLTEALQTFHTDQTAGREIPQ